MGISYAPKNGKPEAEFINGYDSTQGAYLEGGRYPTPIKAFMAVLWSLTGNFNPRNYGSKRHLAQTLSGLVFFDEMRKVGIKLLEDL